MATVSGDGRRPTLVIVDDSEEVRTLVRLRLELAGGFEVVGEGGDGDEAIALAYRHQPSLLLLDTSMPRMDGLEALPAILALAPDTKVVIFTGFEEEGLAEVARELGATDFIEKSVWIEELPDRLLQLVSGSPAPGERRAGRPLRVVSPGRERPHSADQTVLDEHLERFREVFDQAAIGMATLTLNGSIVRANAALAELMQCKPADLVGVDYGRLTCGEGDVLDRSLEAIVYLGEEITSFEHPVPGAENEQTVRVTLAPIRDTKGQALYIFAQIQDISAQRYAEDELRRSEERFRLLVTAIEDYAIYMLDPHGNVVSWNAGAQRIKGYSAAEIIGQNFGVFYPPEERATGHPEQNLDLALRDGVYTEEGWRVRKDGSRFWASIVLTSVYDDEGRHLGFAKITRDQTDQREYEEERREHLEQQAHLLAVTAHELRTPTAVIGGSAETLHSHWHELSEAHRDQLLVSISTSAHRLERLVSDLATASRLQGDHLRLRRDHVTLASALGTSVERTRAANEGAPIELEIQSDATFVADAGRLGQALDNLLDNAVRHGGAPVRVVGSADGDRVRICVSDAGPGVPRELIPRLFERFAIAGPTGGTGLGLYLVREIARGHGGDAVYRPPSEDRPGAFEITLPLEPAVTH